MPGPEKRGLIVQPRDRRVLAELGVTKVFQRWFSWLKSE